MRQEFSSKTKAQAMLRANGKCQGCGIKLEYKKVHFDHDIACELGGDNSLDNCVCLCIPCHKAKTKGRDMPAIAKTRRIELREMGIRKSSTLRSRGFSKAPPQRSASRPLVRAFD